MAAEQSGRPAQRTRTRRAIVAAAMALIAAGREPSVAEIAAAAEVSRRTVYSYFPSLDQLLIDATLGLMSEAEVEPVVDPPGGAPAEERAAALAAEVAEMTPEVERLGRRLIALTVGDEGPAEGPRRGYRRVEWIEAALAPVRDRLDHERYERLVTALSLVIGFEAVLVERDVRGLSPADGAAASAWAARALVRAALDEVS